MRFRLSNLDGSFENELRDLSHIQAYVLNRPLLQRRVNIKYLEFEILALLDWNVAQVSFATIKVCKCGKFLNYDQ